MTTITIERGLLEQAIRSFVGYRRERMLILGDEENEPCDAEKALREALSAPATAPDELERLRKEAERKPITDEDTLALFNRIQTGMRFTDADARPFASGVASAEFFHKIKGTP